MSGHPFKRITVIGAGHVGVPHAATIARKCPNIKVTVVDDDSRKIASWRMQTASPPSNRAVHTDALLIGWPRTLVGHRLTHPRTSRPRRLHSAALL